MARPCLPLLLALPLAGGASCPATPSDCKYESAERCLWEQGDAANIVTGAEEPLGGEGVPVGDPSEPSSVGETELDLSLTKMTEIMSVGLEWSLVDERARELCSMRNGEGQLVATEVTQEAVGDDAWSCPIELDGRPLKLEASSGVISLSSDELDDAQSAQLMEFARRRFHPRCATEFEEFEGTKLEEFLRCALPGGPYLVIARFPRDPEQQRWQLSIAVVDAG